MGFSLVLCFTVSATTVQESIRTSVYRCPKCGYNKTLDSHKQKVCAFIGPKHGMGFIEFGEDLSQMAGSWHDDLKVQQTQKWHR